MNCRRSIFALLLVCFAWPSMAQIPGVYFKLGAQGLDEGGRNWEAPEGMQGMTTYGSDTFPAPSGDLNIPLRGELGGEWALTKDFGLRAGVAVLRIQANSYGWQQGFLDVLWTPWRRENMRLYASAGLGLGSVASTYMVRSETWVLNDSTHQYQYDPGDYRTVDQSGRPFLRVSGGFQLTRFFAVEANADVVSLKRSRTDPWPSTVTNVGLNLVLRIPSE